MVAIPALLIFAQPDLSTAMVFGALFVAAAFAGGARLHQLGGAAGGGALLFAASAKLGVLHPYQVQRLVGFLNQSGGSLGINYQLFQSKAAIGDGGLFGKGIYSSTFASLGYLPEDNTDFVFANLADHVGFMSGVLLLILLLILLLVLIWRILRVAALSQDRFGSLVAVGVATLFAFQVLAKVGMTMGIMPVAGITLPFISYGRNSMAVSVMVLGLVQSVAARSRKRT